MTRKFIYQGRSKNGLYAILMSVIPPPVVAHTASLLVWHQRLAHAHLENVKRVLRRYQIYFPNKRLPSVCSGCCLGKMHKLPFHVYYYKAEGPLDLICSEVWEPVPILSVTTPSLGTLAKIGAGPQTSLQIKSSGPSALYSGTGNGSLCIFPKQKPEQTEGSLLLGKEI
ncbi:hypothetical protein LINPERHAP1_LOCUS6560 [Linum perenne]